MKSNARHLSLLGFALLYLVAGGFPSAARPLWNDELFTYYEIGLPSSAEILAAKLDGVDAAPPLDVLLGHALARVLGHQPWVARLPGLLGILGAALLAHFFARRRVPFSYALIAPFLLVSTGAMPFAYEARSYGLALAFGALALVGWQGAAYGRRRSAWLLALVVGGAGALAAHYYAALVLVALLVGEVVRSVSRRRVDPLVLAALAAPFLLLVPLAPYIATARELAPHTWTAPYFGQIEETYARLFLPAVFPFCTALGLAGILLLVRDRKTPLEPEPVAPVTAAEIAMLTTLLALPFIAVIGAQLVTRVYAPRYALAVTIAPSILVPLVVHRLDRTRGRLALAFLVPLGLVLAYQGADAVAHHRTPPDVVARHPLIADAPAVPMPIAVGNGHVFIQLWHYGPEALRQRLVFVNNIEAALRIEGSDTLARDFDGFSRWFPIPVVDEHPFLDDHGEFWVYDVEFGWLVARLLELGATLEVRARDGGATLYLASMPGASSDTAGP